jgi:hypothetical protein
MLKQNEEIRRFPRFPGGFHTWRQMIFIDQERRSKDVFLVFSSGKREAVRHHLWLKLVWDQLSKIEFELFLSLLKDSDYIYWSFLKLLTFVPKRILRTNLNKAEKLLGLPITSRESYLGSRRISIEIQKETRSLPKTKKFSGYIKSLASRGKSKLGVSRIELETSASTDFVIENDQFVIWEALLSDRR